MTLLTLLSRSYALGISCLVLAACSEGSTGPEELGPDPTAEPAVSEFVVLVNAHRESVGCPAFVWNDGVADVAQAHSDDMVQRDFRDHTNPEGDSPGDRLSEAGLGYSRWGENIAWGYQSADAVLQGWLNSSGHRANIETCELLEHGVGLKDAVWTHVFMTQ